MRRLSFLTPFIIVATIWTVFRSSLFTIDTVSIVAHPDIFSDLSLLTRKNNLIFISIQNLSRELLKNPYIQSVKITKQFPSTLTISINERTPVAYLSQENSTRYVDHEGYIFNYLPRFSQLNLPQIYCESVIETSRIEHKGLVLALSVVAQLQASPLEVRTISCIDEKSVQFEINGVEVVIDDQTDATNLSSSLLFLFKQFRIEGKQPKKVDMRFEKPVLIPDFEEKESSATAF